METEKMPVLSADVLRRVAGEIFRAAGAPDGHAAQVAAVLVDNHLAGHDSHGILRIPEYIRSIERGEIVAAGTPQVLRETATTALVGGNWSFGQVTALFATDIAVEKAKKAGVAAVSVVQAGHTGRLAAFTERAAAQRVLMFMAIGTVDGPMTAPFGGAVPLFGTNPVAFSVPNPGGPPVTLDISTSAIAAGKIKAAMAKGVALPPGAISDRYGSPSTDPQDFFDGGFLMPFGGHKGYALAVIAEVLSGPLTGADSFPGVTNRCGIFMFAVDATAFRPFADFSGSLGRLLGQIKSTPPAPGVERVLVPGEPEAVSRAERMRDGIPIPERTWDDVRKVAAPLGVDIDALAGAWRSR